ncbi:amidohydrolase family protein [Pseudonocardia sp. GCM10023141]|uniref:amidohydrolase family protein n=1 Tax=Pseudonocardia sp. GCM10023141 TaxID=3252653 RepID=UPI0036077F47
MTYTIRGGLILEAQQPDAHRADLRVQDGVIVDIAPELPGASPDDIDATGMLVLPGLIDTHRHMWQTGMRATAFGWTLQQYMTDFQMRLAPHYTPADVYAGNLLGALTALDAGITTVRDESHVQNSWDHTTAAVSALQTAGIRAKFAYGWPSSSDYMKGSTRHHPAQMERARKELLPDDSALVTMNAHLRGPGMSSPDIFAADLARARDLGLAISVHAGSAPRDGVHPGDVESMATAGLLGRDMTLVHCCRCTDDEFAMMAEAGTSASVTAAIETVMPGLGAPALARMRRAGLRPGLGVDVEVAAGGDLFGVMRAALHSHQLQAGLSPEFAQRYPAPSAADLLEFATVSGARALGLEDRVGRLATGLDADIILLRTTDINMIGPGRWLESVTLAANPGNVDTVLVRGVIRKRHGALVGVDQEQVRGLLHESWERLGVASVEKETQWH